MFLENRITWLCQKGNIHDETSLMSSIRSGLLYSDRDLDFLKIFGLHGPQLDIDFSVLGLTESRECALPCRGILVFYNIIISQFLNIFFY